MEILDITAGGNSTDGEMIYVEVETDAGLVRITGTDAIMKGVARTIVRSAVRSAELRSGIVTATPAAGIAVNPSRGGPHILSVRHPDGLEFHYELEPNQIEALRTQLAAL